MSSTNVQRTHQQRARHLADETGMPYTAALRETADSTPEPAPAAKAFATAEDAPWQHLWGHTVRFADPRREAEGEVPHHFTGMVLPPAPGSKAKPWRLRVLPTGRRNPIVVDGRRWKTSPAPATAGRAHYDFEKGPRPPEFLMTANMLKTRLRKAPAKGQHPAAHLDGEWTSTPLYYIDDAEPMPELKGKAAAAWQRNRTCARCGKWSTNGVWPILEASGTRVCPDCRQDVIDEAWRERKRAHCALARTWAAGVLADPDAVLVALADSPARYNKLGPVRVTDTTGRIEHFAADMTPPERVWDDETERIVSADTAADTAWAILYRDFAAAVRGRRIILATTASPGLRLDTWWAPTPRDLGLDPLDIAVETTDQIGVYTDGWKAVLPDNAHERQWNLSVFDLDRHFGGTLHARSIAAAGELTAYAAALLADMATGTAPGLDTDAEEGR